MNFFQKRHLRKLAKHLLHEARHVRHMREDVTAPELLGQLDARAAELRGVWVARDWARIELAAEALYAVIRKVLPAHAAPRFRENLEVVLVALVVAMAFRTYFIQPFKIPTGSMQPTLFGITFHGPSSFKLLDRYPLRLLNFAATGTYPVQIRALADGQARLTRYGYDVNIVRGVDRRGNLRVKTLDTRFEALYYAFGNMPFEIPIPAEFHLYFKNGDYVKKGDLLAAGTIQLGDQIFVNKVKYNFLRPKRGDIIVFDTTQIDHPEIKTNNFYIKRLVGLPGESVGINQPEDSRNVAERCLIVDGKNILEPYPFSRLLQEEEAGYNGYIHVQHDAVPRPLLRHPGDVVKLADDEFLPFGDNTLASLDGRYFGGVKQEDLVGPAFAVYWPFTRRWGRVR